MLDKKRLQELVKEVDPNEQLDEDVEELLLHIADDFIEQTVAARCAVARNRKANSVDVREVQHVLEYRTDYDAGRGGYGMIMKQKLEIPDFIKLCTHLPINLILVHRPSLLNM